MTSRDPKFDAYVLKIHEVLHRLDYYRLLGLEMNSDESSIKKAFHKIAAKFHPDRNRDASPDIKRALYDIFKRLNEAYRILMDDEKRKFYNEGLSGGKIRLETGGRKSAVPKSPEDTIKSLAARKFYVQATEEFEKGNFMNAELHAKVAKGHDPGSRVISDLIEAIRRAKAKPK